MGENKKINNENENKDKKGGGGGGGGGEWYIKKERTSNSIPIGSNEAVSDKLHYLY